jgi:RNA polymerase sigma-70 factor (ECF subfamily)
MDDPNLVTAARNGNRDAFSSLIDQYYQNIYRMAYQFTHCHFEADEVCQETFLRALNSLQTLKNANSFKSWLFSIAANLLRAGLRKKNHLETYIKTSHTPDESEHNQPSQAAMLNEKRVLIHTYLQEIPEQMRLIVILVLMEGVNQKEAARILKCSEATVSRCLSSAKDLLRIKLNSI